MWLRLDFFFVSQHQKMHNLLKRLEVLTNRLELVAHQFSSSFAHDQSNANDNSIDSIDYLLILRDYDILIEQSIKPSITVSQTDRLSFRNYYRSIFTSF